MRKNETRLTLTVMEKSFIYTKKFIDSEIRRLNEPVKIDPVMAPGLSDRQIRQIMNKVNSKIKKHNRSLFSAQVNNQIGQQILKVERQRLSKVSEQLAKIDYIVQPLAVDFDVERLDELAQELPESKYLFINTTQDGKRDTHEYDSVDDFIEPEVNEESSENRKRNHIIQDDSEMVAPETDAFTDELKNALKDDKLIEKYETLRQQLLDLHRDYTYNSEKYDYLLNLQEKLDQINSTKSSSLIDQVNKFNILVDRLQLKLKSRGSTKKDRQS